MFEPGQLRNLCEAAPPPLKAMILLGVNCGFGNTDCGGLPLSALDLDGGWINFPRPKTGVARRCPLWPETREALKEAMASRPQPQGQADKDAVFLLPSGRRWVRHTEKNRTDAISVQFGELLKALGLHRPGLNFYALRHTFRTVADEVLDRVAIDAI